MRTGFLRKSEGRHQPALATQGATVAFSAGCRGDDAILSTLCRGRGGKNLRERGREKPRVYMIVRVCVCARGGCFVRDVIVHGGGHGGCFIRSILMPPDVSQLFSLLNISDTRRKRFPSVRVRLLCCLCEPSNDPSFYSFWKK